MTIGNIIDNNYSLDEINKKLQTIQSHNNNIEEQTEEINKFSIDGINNNSTSTINTEIFNLFNTINDNNGEN